MFKRFYEGEMKKGLSAIFLATLAALLATTGCGRGNAEGERAGDEPHTAASKTPGASASGDAARGQTAASGKRGASNRAEAEESADSPSEAGAEVPAEPPTTIRNAVAAIDLAKIPKLPGAMQATEHATTTFYQCTTDAAKFDAHFRNELGKLGWKEDKAADVATTYFTYIKTELRSSVNAWAMPNSDLTRVSVYFADDEDRAAAKAAPRLPGAKEICATKSSISYTVAKPVSEVIAASRKELEAGGWNVEPTTTSLTHILYFHKGAMQLYCALNVWPGQPSSVSVLATGNVDVRKLPRPKELPAFSYHKAADSPQGVYYRTALPVKDVVAFAAKEMTALGWQPFEPLDKAATSEVRKQFRQNGMTLDVVAEAMEDKNTVVYYTTGMFPFDLPITDDAYEVRLESYTGHAVYATKSTIDAAVKELGNKLKANGWTMDEKLSVVGKREHKRAWRNAVSADPMVLNVVTIGKKTFVEFRAVAEASLAKEFSKPSNKGDEE
jgi:hypothetical protein